MAQLYARKRRLGDLLQGESGTTVGQNREVVSIAGTTGVELQIGTILQQDSSTGEVTIPASATDIDNPVIYIGDDPIFNPDVNGVHDFDPNTTVFGTGLLSVPVQAAAATATTGGSLPATTQYFLKVVAVNAAGTTTASNEVSITTGAGTTNTITANWTPVAGATGYRVYLGTAAGGENKYFAASGQSTATLTITSTTGTNGDIPTNNTAITQTGTAKVVILYRGYAGVAIGKAALIYPSDATTQNKLDIQKLLDGKGFKLVEQVAFPSGL